MLSSHAVPESLAHQQAGGPPPPGDSIGGSGGDGGGPHSRQSTPNELAEIAAGRKPITLTLASFAVTRKAYGKVSRTSSIASILFLHPHCLPFNAHRNFKLFSLFLINLSCYSYSLLASVLQIVRRFVHEYERATGRAVRFRLTFAGSGTQARAIIDGLPVDIAALALPLDILKIEEAGLIDPGWASRFPNRSIVNQSVVSIVVRQGNPKGIKGWEDLIR